MRNASRIALALSGLALAATAQAQQSNFQFSPPPIPYPYFEPARFDARVGGQYFGVSGSGFRLDIVGAGLMARKAINEDWAFGGNLGLVGGTGNIDLGAAVGGKLNMFLFNMDPGVHGEYQFINRPRGSLLTFVGINFPITIITFDKYFNVTSGGQTSSISPTSITTILFGVPMGLQGGINLGEKWRFAPFFALTPFLGGTAFSSYATVGPLTPEQSTSIDPFLSTSMGGDIIFVPWDLSLGTLFQQAASSGKNKEVKTLMIALAWHFRK